MRSNTFFETTAVEQGGAIYYNKYEPQILVPNSYYSTNAPYGPNIAGYAISLRIDSYTDYVLGSGIPYEGRFQVSLIDKHGQVMEIDNETPIKIQPEDLSISQLGGSTE